MSSRIAAEVEPHIPALRRYAYALTRDPATADDLVQDTLERALGRWFLRRPDGDLRAWMFTILHNLYIGGKRRDRRRGAMDELNDQDAPTPPDQDGALLRRDIVSGLRSLSEEQRAVLLLVGVEGLSYENAGTVLGIPLGTVMSRLSRARENLRRLLDGERAPALRRVK